MATITIWSDIGCPWAHAAVWRLHEARSRLNLEEQVTFDHRPFPLELVNSQATPWAALSAEVPVVAGIAPGAGWRQWSGPLWQWPVTTLPALEAVQAARAQHAAAAEQLDRALRVAFFGEGRCISLRHVILDAARDCPAVDAGALAAALDAGTARQAVIDSWREAVGGDVAGSPYVVLPGGQAVFNPGVEVRWVGPEDGGFPVVEKDDPAAYDDLLRHAATA